MPMQTALKPSGCIHEPTRCQDTAIDTMDGKALACSCNSDLFARCLARGLFEV